MEPAESKITKLLLGTLLKLCVAVRTKHFYKKVVEKMFGSGPNIEGFCGGLSTSKV